MIAKKCALKYATNAAATVLWVDQIIMGKRTEDGRAQARQGVPQQGQDVSAEEDHSIPVRIYPSVCRVVSGSPAQ